MDNENTNNGANDMTAKPIDNAVEILTAATLPDGVKVVTVPCEDYAALKALPKAIEYKGDIYGRSGWNSDTCVAYYRTDKAVARSW
jgi:hypothetical protein